MSHIFNNVLCITFVILFVNVPNDFLRGRIKWMLTVYSDILTGTTAWYRRWRPIYPSWFRYVFCLVDEALLTSVADFWWCVAGIVHVLQCDYCSWVHFTKIVVSRSQATGFCSWANRFCPLLARWASDIFGGILGGFPYCRSTVRDVQKILY